MIPIKTWVDKNINSREKKVILGNIFSLSTLQIVNYLLPLITVPYLMRVVGPDKYGLIAFAQAFMQYFIIATTYGFNFSATREISTNRGDAVKVSQIFNSVMFIKFILLTICFFTFIAIVYSFSIFRNDWPIYIFSFGTVVGDMLFPVWFFQGIEKMKYITILNVISKSIFTLFIFILIKEQQDYLYVPLINSIGFIVAGIFGLYIAFKNYQIRLVVPAVSSIKYHLKEGWHIFISMLSISLYTTSNTFILGFFTNTTVVGYYAAAEKIIRLILQLFRPFSQAMFPYISKLAKESKERTIDILNKLLYSTFCVFFIIIVIVNIFANNIVYIILGDQFTSSIIILRISSLLLIIIPMASIFANLSILPFKLDRNLSKIYITGGILNLFLLFLLLYVYPLEGAGAAISNLITEFFLTIMMFTVLRSNNVRLLF